MQWSQFYDVTLEKRLSHDGDRRMARQVDNLSLISGPWGPRPDLDVAEGVPIATAPGAIITYDGVTRTETLEVQQVIQL